MNITDIVKKINDLKSKHETLKNEVINDLNEIKLYEIRVNEKIKILDNIEKEYIELVEKIYDNK